METKEYFEKVMQDFNQNRRYHSEDSKAQS